MSAIDRLLWALDSVAHRLRIGLEILRRLPIVKCPACGGAGGEIQGYYEPEWCECRHCYDQTEMLQDHGLEWFEGRINPLRWPWVKFRATNAAGAWTFTGWALCRTGVHVTDDDGICMRCHDYERTGR